MRFIRNQRAWVLMLACAAAVIGAAAPAVHSAPTTRLSKTPKLPEKLLPFVDLSKNCAAYDQQVNSIEWKTIWQETFDTAKADHWLPTADEKASPPFVGTTAMTAWPTISAGTVDHREVAIADSTNIKGGYWPVGPKVHGDFAVEFIGQTQSANPCDLSIYLESPFKGLGFQFGGFMNTRNVMWVPAPNADDSAMAVELPNQPLLETGKWFTVRLEVRKGVIRASVNGQTVGTQQIRSLGDRELQPLIYAYHSQIAIDEVKIEGQVATPKAVDPDQVFATLFGNQSRKDVADQIDKLVEMLDDRNAPVREGASRLLRGMGMLTVPALKEAIDNGSPEAALRAQAIYNRIVPPAPKIPTTLPTAGPP